MSVCAGATYQLKELNNVFIEMTSKNCNQRCSSCFIEFQTGCKNKDFISVDTVKNGLRDIKNENVYCIYLSGAEPMTHPEFNAILRLCLKKCNVCICTNGSFLNEKKIRFLKKVEDEGNNQIFFKLTLTHYNELENDKARYRGNFRQIISALKILSRYNFTTVISFQNFYNLDVNDITEHFQMLFETHGITNTDLQISVSYPSDCEDTVNSQLIIPDCTKGRVLTQNGVYACPFLANDYRGRCGSSLNNFSRTINAETDFCMTCAKNKKAVFAIG